MSALSDLPNVGKVLEDYLLQIGITTPEQLKSAGAEEAFIRIRLQVDSGACLHMLYGIQGAIDGVKDSCLTDDVKQGLKEFYKTLS